MLEIIRMDQKTGPKYMLSISNQYKYKYKYKGIYGLKVNGWRKMCPTNTNQKSSILILNSGIQSKDIYQFWIAEFKAKTFIRAREGYYIMIKESVLQEIMTVL